MKENNTLGIVSLILGILAALSSLIFIISIPLAIASAICGIIALAKKKKKAMPIIGIVLSIISILFSAGIILLVGVVFSNINDDDIRSALVRAYNNTTSESETQNIDTNNKLTGKSWILEDDSLLELGDNGIYYWYQNKDDKTDNYYTGRYNTCFGDSAIEKIKEAYSFNEEALNNNNYVLRRDIYYLELNKEQAVVNGKLTNVNQVTKMALFFVYTIPDKCTGINMSTLNYVNMELQK